MHSQRIHLIGFGSQGAAWANCLRQSGWDVQVYLSRQGHSYQRAKEQGFVPVSVEALPEQIADASVCHTIVMLCPDPEVGSLYKKFIEKTQGPVRIILAHGFAVYSGDLVIQNPVHRVLLLAPKAIGPKLLENFKNSYPESHSLVAAISASEEDTSHLREVASGLGFAERSLVPTTLEVETMGDLMSEQGLLCGGVFNLLQWTYEAMKKAEIPEALIREECLTELELIAGMIRKLGPAQTFQCISQVAQAGTIAMGERFEQSGFKEKFMAQMDEVTSRKFVSYFQSENWRPRAKQLRDQFVEWGGELK